MSTSLLKPLFLNGGGTTTSAQITDSTAAGRALLTASDEAAQLALIGAMDRKNLAKIQLKNTRVKLQARMDAATGDDPLSIMIYGDSISETMGDIPLLKGQQLVGYKFSNQSSTISGAVTSISGEYEDWLTGVYKSHAVGSVSNYCRSGSGGIDFVANRIAVGYLKHSAGATFDLQYDLGADGSWQTAVTGINTYSATPDSGYAVYTVTNPNLKTVRVRIANVVQGSGGVGATAKILGCGYWINGVGGYVVAQCAKGGLDLDYAPGLPQPTEVPDAVVSSFMAALRPDLMVSSFLNTSSDWEVGGVFDTMYAKFKAGWTAFDMLLVGPPPQTDTYYLTYPLQDPVMDAWATRNGESFISTVDMFRDRSAAVVGGFMVGGADNHMTGAGYAARDRMIAERLAQSLGNIGVSSVPISRGVSITHSGGNNSPVRIGGDHYSPTTTAGIYLPGGNAYNAILLGSRTSSNATEALEIFYTGTAASESQTFSVKDPTTTLTLATMTASGNTTTGKITHSSNWPLRIKMKKSSGADPSDADVGAGAGIIFVRLNGSSKMEFCVKFPTGAVQVIATEP